MRDPLDRIGFNPTLDGVRAYLVFDGGKEKSPPPVLTLPFSV